MQYFIIVNLPISACSEYKHVFVHELFSFLRHEQELDLCVQSNQADSFDQ